MSRFLTVFSVTSMFFGGFITFARLSVYQDTLLMSLLVGVCAGVLFGVITGGIACILAALMGYSCLNFMVVTLAVGIVGLLAGMGIYVIGVGLVPSGRWEPILGPPEKPVEFVTNSPFTSWGGAIYVRTVNDSLYSYTCNSENPCIWKKETSVPDRFGPNHWTCGSNEETRYAPPPPRAPGAVKDSYEANMCGPDAINQSNLIILEDGTIWVWSKISGQESIYFLMLCGVVSPIIALVGAFALLIRRDW